MDGENQIHVSIEKLEQIVTKAKTIQKENSGMSNIVRITKTAFRQTGDAEDKIEHYLLASCTIPESVVEE